MTELKRGAAPDAVEMQAIKYAVMASRFTIETLAEQYAHYLSQCGAATDAEAVIDLLDRHAPDIGAGSLRRTRIVLVASSFPSSTSATAIWLHEMGINIALRQFREYRTGEEISIAVSQLYPVPDVEEFMYSPRQADVRAAVQTAQRRQEVGTVACIIAAELLEDGALLTVRPYGINAELREQVELWRAVDPAPGRARWHNDDTEPIEWDAVGVRYTPATLGKLILREATGIDRTLRGGDWFVDDEGRSLVQLAVQTQGDLEAPYLRLWSMLLESSVIGTPTGLDAAAHPQRAGSASRLPSLMPDGPWLLPAGLGFEASSTSTTMIWARIRNSRHVATRLRPLWARNCRGKTSRPEQRRGSRYIVPAASNASRSIRRTWTGSSRARSD